MNPMAVCFSFKKYEPGINSKFYASTCVEDEQCDGLGSKRKKTGAFENAEVVNKHGNSQVTVILLGIRRR